MDLPKLVSRARTSAFYRTILNWALDRMIPFNRPHGFKILAVTDTGLKVLLPYRKRNLNHIRGLHACALATVSEFTTGFLLVSKLDARKYRLIMQKLEMDYHYQGKMDAFAEFSLQPDWIAETIYEPLKIQEAIVIVCEIKIHDAQGNHLTTGHVHWQIKDWSKVKTRQ